MQGQSHCTDDCLVCKVYPGMQGQSYSMDDSGMQGVPCIPDSHPHRITSTKCRKNTIVSPDDGHTVARNM